MQTLDQAQDEYRTPLGWDTLWWDKDFWVTQDAPAIRYVELHDEIERFRRAAEHGDKTAARLIFRMSKMWCVHCVFGHSPLHDAEPRLWHELMVAEDEYCDRTGERVVAGTEFLKENPEHEITRSRAGRAWLQHVKDRNSFTAAQAAQQEREQVISMGPARGGPTDFYFDPRLELPENVKKARKLDLAGWERLSLAQHCELAGRWATHSDHKAGTRSPPPEGLV